MSTTFYVSIWALQVAVCAFIVYTRIYGPEPIIKLIVKAKRLYKRGKFKKGDEVYFNVNHFLLTKPGKVYVVQDIAFSPCCGVEWVNVGVDIPVNQKGLCKRCIKCGKGGIPMPGKGQLYFEATNIAKVEDIEILELIEAAKPKQNS